MDESNSSETLRSCSALSGYNLTTPTVLLASVSYIHKPQPPVSMTVFHMNLNYPVPLGFLFTCSKTEPLALNSILPSVFLVFISTVIKTGCGFCSYLAKKGGTCLLLMVLQNFAWNCRHTVRSIFELNTRRSTLGHQYKLYKKLPVSGTRATFSANVL